MPFKRVYRPVRETLWLRTTQSTSEPYIAAVEASKRGIPSGHNSDAYSRFGLDSQRKRGFAGCCVRHAAQVLIGIGHSKESRRVDLRLGHSAQLESTTSAHFRNSCSALADDEASY